ncbi:hypothetical protein DL93DRAFT_2072531 [Clavulina sp. PMI_390]|nr:hypothetical protein DL93DRAFT_2072531 [Clavulina sp. PMI_390]
MHYSRVSVAPSEEYSAASAVLMTELMKCSISFFVALSQMEDGPGVLDPSTPASKSRKRSSSFATTPASSFNLALWMRKASILRKEIFSADCWKLSIPAILYVIQNNLQFVAASNLDVATFQVTYQMKILTTAAFSVLMLGKRLTAKKWAALLCLALGVGIVQIQSGSPTSHAPSASASTGTSASPELLVDDIPALAAVLNQTLSDSVADAVETVHETVMSPFKGFMAVSLACVTSGLAGVYFEMVLKGSKVNIWIRNVQMSLFSFIPALAPVLFSNGAPGLFGFLKNFGLWAWSTVFIQVFGGLITAIVIKYSDNIMKGFATSLSIVLSFLASVVLFNFSITPSFIVGATTVLSATAAYNQPEAPANSEGGARGGLLSQVTSSINDKKRPSVTSLKSFVPSFISASQSSPDGRLPFTSPSPSKSTYPLGSTNGNSYPSSPPYVPRKSSDLYNPQYSPSYNSRSLSGSSDARGDSHYRDDSSRLVPPVVAPSNGQARKAH